jgi:hypothetical protein
MPHNQSALLRNVCWMAAAWVVPFDYLCDLGTQIRWRTECTLLACHPLNGDDSCAHVAENVVAHSQAPS